MTDPIKKKRKSQNDSILYPKVFFPIMTIEHAV